ncbi:cysteine hydrolase [Cryobacterium sp.]|jgi:nicotinamidase-related amidase|uniref:cysteine hydrolase family protein n=1 Tax=Cryobacterium sp. TaxID=1926290 RepID=UPI0026048BE8|nr:cysteine hydrolase [Cryobacterium sp.]MCU1447533.1 isochorismatase [Cryobacterium sp.]
MSPAGPFHGLDNRAGALIVVDVQRSFADVGYLSGYGLDTAAEEALAAAIRTTASLVDTARAAGVPVVWVELASDPNRLWGASNWLRGKGVDEPMGDDEPCVIGTPGADWYGVSPAAGEVRVQKRAYSGFQGTDLHARLQELGVVWVIVAGLTTECCIAATATDAFQLDYPVLIPSDATAAYEVRVHENALEILALTTAHIVSSEELVGFLPAAAPVTAAPTGSAVSA